MLDHLHSHCGGTSYMCHTPKSIGQPSEVVHFLFFKRTLFAQFFCHCWFANTFEVLNNASRRDWSGNDN